MHLAIPCVILQDMKRRTEPQDAVGKIRKEDPRRQVTGHRAVVPISTAEEAPMAYRDGPLVHPDMPRDTQHRTREQGLACLSRPQCHSGRGGRDVPAQEDRATPRLPSQLKPRHAEKGN